jgi:hypothetical protein
MVIEMYDDMIRISHGFEGCQLSIYIADSVISSLNTGKDYILNFLYP